MNKLKKNDLIKARKLCNIFRFIDDLNSINDEGEFESNYSNIYPEELQLGKENTDKNEASFLDLNIKSKDVKFHFGLFDKRDSFPFSIVNLSLLARVRELLQNLNFTRKTLCYCKI